MATLTSSEVIISVSVLFSLTPLIWVFFYFIDRWRNQKDKSFESKKIININNDEFLISIYAKSAFFITIAMWIAACIIMIVFSMDNGNTINRVN
jgi:flagellar biosynthesis protein FlhB